jgi:hypothetical protein
LFLAYLKVPSPKLVEVAREWSNPYLARQPRVNTSSTLTSTTYHLPDKSQIIFGDCDVAHISQTATDAWKGALLISVPANLKFVCSGSLTVKIDSIVAKLFQLPVELYAISNHSLVKVLDCLRVRKTESEVKPGRKCEGLLPMLQRINRKQEAMKVLEKNSVTMFKLEPKIKVTLVKRPRDSDIGDVYVEVI